MWRALTANALGALKRHWQDVVIVTALCALSLWVRRLTLWDIEGGGDAVRKWFFVKQWAYANSFREIPWNHHMSRVGINAWAYLTQQLWGTDAAVYFIAPVVAATAGVVFCYKLGQELGGRFAGLIAALWFTTTESMERAGSQLLPEAFEAAYVAGAVYFFLWYLRYQGSVKWRRVLLGLVGVLLFGAYLTKVSNLLFVPGILIAGWFCGGNRRDLLMLTAGLVAGFLLETLWYNVFTEYTSQFAIISESHRGGTVKSVLRTVKTGADSVAGVGSGGGRGGGAAAPHTEKVLDLMSLLWKLLERYQVVWESIKFPLFLFLGASIALSVFAQQPAVKVITIIVFVQLFCTTFAIRQFSPIKVWLSNEPRYMIVLCPLLFATNAAFFVELARRAGKALSARLSGRWLALPRLRRWSSATLPYLALVCTFVLCGLIAKRYYDTNAKRALEWDVPLRGVRMSQYSLSNAYIRGLPIVEKRSKDKKALQLIYSIYLQDKLIQRGGQLPSFEKAVERLDGSYDWLSKAPRAYSADAQAKIKGDRSCAYVTHIRGRYLNKSPDQKLNPRCKAKAGAAD